MNYQNLSQTIDRIAPALLAMSDNIFDHPEEGLQEYYAVEQLTGWLEQEGISCGTRCSGCGNCIPRHLE